MLKSQELRNNGSDVKKKGKKQSLKYLEKPYNRQSDRYRQPTSYSMNFNNIPLNSKSYLDSNIESAISEVSQKSTSRSKYKSVDKQMPPNLQPNGDNMDNQVSLNEISNSDVINMVRNMSPPINRKILLDIRGSSFRMINAATKKANKPKVKKYAKSPRQFLTTNITKSDISKPIVGSQSKIITKASKYLRDSKLSNLTTNSDATNNHGSRDFDNEKRKKSLKNNQSKPASKNYYSSIVMYDSPKQPHIGKITQANPKLLTLSQNINSDLGSERDKSMDSNGKSSERRYEPVSCSIDSISLSKQSTKSEMIKLLKKQLSVVSSENTKLKTENKSLRQILKDYEKMKLAESDNNDRILELKSTNSTLSSDMKSYKAKISKLETKINNLEQTNKSLVDEKSKVEAKLKKMEKDSELNMNHMETK